MSKVPTRVQRKDSEDEHAHKLPDGSFTGPMLYKPNRDRSFPHSHLYEHDGKTLETGVAPIGGDHTHDCKSEDVVGDEAETGGPVPVPKNPGKAIPRERNDAADPAPKRLFRKR